jgi:hypothetical protein
VLVPDLNQDPFEPAQWPITERDGLTHIQVLTRFGGETRLNDLLYGFNFSILNRNGRLAVTDDQQHAWRGQQGQTPRQFNTAE